jgi:hypothetical protein
MIEPMRSQAADASTSEHHVVFVEHFLDEVKRNVK